MPQQVSPSINDDIYPGNKTILQVSLGGPYALSCESGSHLGVEMVIRESLPSPPPKKKAPRNSASLGCWVGCQREATPFHLSPPPPPPKSRSSASSKNSASLGVGLAIWESLTLQPPPPHPPTLFLKNSGYCGVYILWWETC